MKGARFVLKIVAFFLAGAAAARCVIAYWDKIVAFFGCAREKLAEKGPAAAAPPSTTTTPTGTRE